MPISFYNFRTEIKGNESRSEVAVNNIIVI